jgi:hypothetical protein
MYEYDDTFECENGDGMGHYHCDMAQCEDKYINEMHGIQRERENNNKSEDLKNDTWASLNVMQFRSSDGRFASAKNRYTCRGGGVYIYKLEEGIADSSLRIVYGGEGDDGEVEKLEFRKPICI